MSIQNQQTRSRRRIAGERRPPSSPPRTATAQPKQSQRPTGRDRLPAPKSAPRSAPRSARGLGRGLGRGSGPSWLLVAVLGGLALVLLATALFLGLVTWSYGSVREQDRVDEASRTAPAAAERASAAVLSYGYQSLDADEKAAERYLTPSYAAKYAETYDRLVRPNATKLRAKVEAVVKASGVAHADADRVNVLLYVDQTTTSTANGGQPQTALNRVQFSMVRRGGTWLVDDITSY